MRISSAAIAAVAAMFSIATAHSATPFNYMSSALQGDLSGAETALEESENADDKEILSKFNARFLARTDGLDLAQIENTAVRQVATAYQDYWRDALLAPQTREERELALIDQIRQIIDEDDVAVTGAASKFVSDAELDRLRTDKERSVYGRSLISKRLVPWIEARGYKALTGRSQPLLELMLWSHNRKESEVVELTDGVFTVPVTYQKDFIASGWSYFATFERARTGGWANADGLFVVADAYDDLGDESFQVSFLKHEARHFVDSTKFPEIAPADREYRAKLTELIYAQDSMEKILMQFVHGGAKIDVSHPLANWFVIHDLASALYGENPPIEWWADVDQDLLRAAAASLLEQNTATLDEAGAMTTKGVIRP